MREVEKSIAVNFLVEYKADKWRDNTSTKRAPCQLIFRREAWEDISFVESSDTESLSFASTSSPIREEKEPNSQSIEDALTYIEEYFQSRRVLFTDFRKFLQRRSKESYFLFGKHLRGAQDKIEEIKILKLFQMVTFPRQTDQLIDRLLKEENEENLKLLMDHINSTLYSLFSEYLSQNTN
eukprot:TRINITY_DN857_c0_g1_i1.p1 TRINITY_DN857_c0_g1~~TRINITY_DN857_c0_g1_i1.p1  ORF type:complete len:181 (+),score=34.44 TRINITY_DN857_c0_g1_i1:485-1027(+)